MIRVKNQQRQVYEGESQSQRDWDGVDGVRQEAGSREKVKHIERNNQLFITRMMSVQHISELNKNQYRFKKLSTATRKFISTFCNNTMIFIHSPNDHRL